ncbi:hypothetical protein [Rhizobium phage RHph_X2_28B]|uniref:exonuclease n=1 Tax=Rhizobium phage RHph_X2_28B TaxID=2836086 RepID=UPI0023299610|nr:exonuclease [Rhizobium phage RHph_X2_28B]QWY83512.1 hypothetical protein [Rhizobium phage RHph_X2_28B]QWY83748.1 hypothetical protein [Rhizobium phage RHph_X3_15]
MRITNNSGIELPMAVWLLHDEYDYDDTPNYISATRLLRPLKHIVMGARVPNEVKEIDVSDFIARASGHAYHAAIEKAWLNGNHRRPMKILGYSDEIIDRVVVNPTDEELRSRNDIIPVYIEQRVKRSLDGFVIGGKFDMLCDGMLQDNKSTSAMTWVYGGRDEEHKLQGSLYRWLNPQKVTEDFLRINYIFTDWNKASARQNPNYPQKKLEKKDIKLMSLQETETWIRNKLRLIVKYKDAPESEIPECTDEELWRSEPVFKYYSDPSKTDGRATRRFDTMGEANAFMNEKGKGIVKTVPGEVKRCGYCDVFPICKQKDRYFGSDE